MMRVFRKSDYPFSEARSRPVERLKFPVGTSSRSLKSLPSPANSRLSSGPSKLQQHPQITYMQRQAASSYRRSAAPPVRLHSGTARQVLSPSPTKGKIIKRGLVSKKGEAARMSAVAPSGSSRRNAAEKAMKEQMELMRAGAPSPRPKPAAAPASHAAGKCPGQNRVAAPQRPSGHPGSRAPCRHAGTPTPASSNFQAAYAAANRPQPGMPAQLPRRSLLAGLPQEGRMPQHKPMAARRPQMKEEDWDEYEDEGDFVDTEGPGDGDWRSLLQGITRYNPNKYQHERDDRSMEASWQQIQAEERRSARAVAAASAYRAHERLLRYETRSETIAWFCNLLSISGPEAKQLALVLAGVHPTSPTNVWLPAFLQILAELEITDSSAVVHILGSNPRIRQTSIQDLSSTLQCIRGIIQEGAQVRRMMLQYPAWWTRSAERLEQVTADYERLGFSHDTIKFVFAAGHPTVHADTAFGPEKLRFMQEQAWMEPQQVLAEDRAFLQRSLDKRIRPRVLLMLFREHPGCWNFPDLGRLLGPSDQHFCNELAFVNLEEYSSYVERLSNPGQSSTPITPTRLSNPGRPPSYSRAVAAPKRSFEPQSPIATHGYAAGLDAYCPVDPSATKPISYLDKLTSVQQTLGVDREIADELTSVLDSDECSIPQQQGLDTWLAELASCWTGTGFPIIRVVPVLQKQPGLRFVQVETIQTTLNWLCGFFESSAVVLDEVEKHPQWLAVDSRQLGTVLASFREMGFDDETLREIATSAPPKIAFLAPEAPQKLHFMRNALGRTPSSVLREFPRFCVYSLSKVIAPRILFILHLQHPACYDFPDLKSVCTTNEPKFCSNVALAAQHQYQQFMDHMSASGAATP
ncbi:hypothetical protein WJX84_000949 [Apatococcus fuscideae]|uniref:Uncharacterized protein n=1 Tax=Apatococcus fuscideae TaxID=2026836 RepID=A0AAW1T441_9CHLO